MGKKTIFYTWLRLVAIVSFHFSSNTFLLQIFFFYPWRRFYLSSFPACLCSIAHFPLYFNNIQCIFPQQYVHHTEGRCLMARDFVRPRLMHQAKCNFESFVRNSCRCCCFLFFLPMKLSRKFRFTIRIKAVVQSIDFVCFYIYIFNVSRQRRHKWCTKNAHIGSVCFVVLCREAWGWVESCAKKNGFVRVIHFPLQSIWNRRLDKCFAEAWFLFLLLFPFYLCLNFEQCVCLC